MMTFKRLTVLVTFLFIVITYAPPTHAQDLSPFGDPPPAAMEREEISGPFPTRDVLTINRKRIRLPWESIEVIFKQEIDKQSLRGALTLSTSDRFELDWNGNTLLISPIDGLFTSGELTVKIDTSLLALSGDPILEAAFQRKLTIAPAEAFASFYRSENMPEIYAIDAGSDLLVPITSIAQGLEIDFALKTYDLETQTEGELLERWTKEFGVGLFSDPETDHPVNFVELPEVTSGVYLLEIGGPDLVTDRQIIALNQYNLLSISDGNLVTIWATDYQNRPVNNLTITAYQHGAPLQQMTTSEDGLATFALPNAGDDVLFVGEKNGTISISSPGEAWRVEPSGGSLHTRNKIMLYANKPTYHLGETIHFRGILRVPSGQNLNPPPFESPVTVEISPQNRNIEPIELTTDHFGTVEGSYAIPSDWIYGELRLTLTFGDNQQALVLPISQGNKSPYEIELLERPSFVIRGEEMTGRLRLNPLNGKLNGHERVKVIILCNFNRWRGDQQIVDLANGWSPLKTEVFSVDDEGESEFSMRLNADTELPTYASLALFIEVLETSRDGKDDWGDANGLFIPIDNVTASESIRLKSINQLYTVGDQVDVLATISDRKGGPVADRSISILVEKTGTYAREAPEPIPAITELSDQSGELKTSLILNDPGEYQIIVSGEDETGRAYQDQAEFFVIEENPTIGIDDYDYAGRIWTNKTDYRPGETAFVVLDALEEVEYALLTISDHQLIETHVIQLRNGLARVDIPIPDTATFDISLSLHTLHNLEATALQYWGGIKKNRQIATAQLKIEPQNDLTVRLLEEEIDIADGFVDYVIEVANRDGLPVSSELSFGAVPSDEWHVMGAMAPYEAAGQDLRSTHPNYMTIAHSFAPFLDLLQGLHGCGCCCGGGYYPRFFYSDGGDRAFWQSNIGTDVNGRAVVRLPLTQIGNGPIQIDVVAVTADGQLGLGEFVVTPQDQVN